MSVRRHHHRETRTLVRCAGYIHMAAVQFYDLIDDGKANASTRLTGSLRTPGAIKLSTDFAELLGVHADSLVFHR